MDENKVPEDKGESASEKEEEKKEIKKLPGQIDSDDEGRSPSLPGVKEGKKKKTQLFRTTGRMKALSLAEVEAATEESDEEGGFAAQSILHGAIIMMAVHMVSRILGLLRELLLMKHFGVGHESDAFFTAELFCVHFPLFFGEALAIILVTIFSEYRAKSSLKEAWTVTTTLTTLMVVALLVLSGVMLLAFPYIIPLVYSYDQQTIDYALSLIKIMLPVVVFIVLMFISMGVFESYKHFTLPSLFYVIINAFIIGGILILDGYYGFGIHGPGYGYTAGVICGALLYWVILAKKIPNFKWRFEWKHPGVKKTLKLTLPLFFTNSTFLLVVFIDQLFASTLVKGSLSALNYGYIIHYMVPSFFFMALMKAFFPSLSDYIQENDEEEASELFHNVMDLLIYSLLPLSIFFFIFSEDIIRIAFERGEFGREATLMTAQTLAYYSLGMIFITAVEVAKSVYLAHQDVRVPFISQILFIILNVVLNFLLIKYLLVGGLALASSISHLIVTAFLLVLLHRNYLPLNWKSFGKSFLWLTIFAALGNGLAVVANQFLRANFTPLNIFGELAILGGVFTAGAGLYIILSLVFRQPIITFLLDILRHRILVKLPWWDEVEDEEN